MGMLLIWLVNLYSIIILIWVVASWIPDLRRYQPVQLCGRLSEPYLRLFRRIIPPLGGSLDITPILALVALQLVARLLGGG